MRKLLVIPALVLLVSAVYFWIWAGEPPPPVPDENERFALAEELKGKKTTDDLSPEWLARAKKIGVTPEQGRRELEVRGTKLASPKDIRVWSVALSLPFKERERAVERLEYYGMWRIPLCTGAIGLAILLGALAFKKPKSPSLSGRS
jgi:hypothetical protein